jgi:hypothetical protein
MSIHVIFQRALPKFVANFPSLLPNKFPSSEIGRELRNEVRKFISMFELLVSQMFIVQIEINNSMESSWSSGLPRRLYFIELVIIIELCTFVFKRSSNIEIYSCELRCEVHAQFSNLET